MGRLLPLTTLHADPNNERTSEALEPGSLDMEELIASVREVGINTPIEVYELPDGEYRIKAGHRRAAAARAAGLELVPAVVVGPLPDEVTLDVGRTLSNLLSKEVSAIHLARTFKRLIDQGSITQDALAARFGKSQPWLSNTLRLLELPEAIQQYIIDGRLSAAHGVQLLRIREPEVEQWNGTLTGKSALDVQTRLADAAAGNGSSSKGLASYIDDYLKKQAEGHQRLEANRKADAAAAEKKRRMEAIAAGASAAGQDPKEAVAAAEQAEKDARRAEQATKEKAEAEHREACKSVARAIVHSNLAAPTGEPIRLEALRHAVMVIAARCHLAGTQNETLTYFARIEAASNQVELLAILAEIIPLSVSLEFDGLAISTYSNDTKALDARLGLNRQIAEALKAKNLLKARQYEALLKTAAPMPVAPRPQPAAASADEPPPEPALMTQFGPVDGTLQCTLCGGAVARRGYQCVCVACGTHSHIQHLDDPPAIQFVVLWHIDRWETAEAEEQALDTAAQHSDALTDAARLLVQGPAAIVEEERQLAGESQ